MRQHLYNKDFNFVRKFPVSYSRNGFDDEGLLYLLDQASGLISYYDSKTDTFTEDVNYVIRYPDEMFGGGHKEVIIRKNSCFFSYSSEDGITEKLFDGIDYGMDMENVYGCYRDGDDSIVVVYKGYWNSLDVYENSYDRDFWDEGVFKAVFTKAKADTQDEPADTSASLE